ncbi:unnamed protein product, partial [Cyprideis torosa]
MTPSYLYEPLSVCAIVQLTLFCVGMGFLVAVCNARPDAAARSDTFDIRDVLPSLSKQQREAVEEIRKIVSGFSAKEKLEFRRALERQAQAPVPRVADLSKKSLDNVSLFLNKFYKFPINILVATVILPLLLPGIPNFFFFELIGQLKW